ncbi:hypothetical protein PGT21_006023 [Puccinia graminis f. sp. tritici]|uniref:SWIM-type domain-containing protein n=1 Tax=Puccinia graminis f. sp. tritici TaxID=56615 RepID=A0A5B0MN10_PUCGR|nr:hypothetical protein PGT21_006023 [Puccinia graminis f. sp. tritici]
MMSQTAHQGIHTNNYTEAWHRVLKSKYILPNERRRIDHVVKILVEKVESNYRWTQARVEDGFMKQTSNKFQRRAKALADGYSAEFIALLGIRSIKNPSHFKINSFTNPELISYSVAYTHTHHCLKGQLTKCTCDHYMRFGSACKHMYYLARVQEMMVVETAATVTSIDDTDTRKTKATETTDYNMEILFPPSDSEVEIIRPLLRPQKRRIEETELSIPPGTSAKKQRLPYRRPALAQSIPFVTPSVAVDCSDGTCRKKFCTCPTLAENTDLALDLSGADFGTDEDRLRFKQKSEASARSALKRMLEIMKTIKNRREFVKNSSPAMMEYYMGCMYSIMKMVEVTCPGGYLTPEPQIPGASEASTMNGQQTQALMMNLQTAGWGYLKRVINLVGDENYCTNFCAVSTCLQLDLYKSRCWRALDTVLDNCPSLKTRTQIR